MRHQKIWEEYSKRNGNISQEELAALCGCSVCTVSKALTKHLTKK
jgi:DeoR/GlpR family transcriptional regulator of sugar metabolism